MQDIKFDQVIGNIGWKDSQLRHLGCNQQLAAALQLHTHEIIGLRDHDLPGITKKDCQFHLETDQLALKGLTINKLHRHQHSLYFIIKKPFYNAENKIDGVIYHCQLIEDANFRQQPSSITNNYPFQLSTREHECLHYTMQGKTAQWIAGKLGLSRRTIESYIENIKTKMGCENKAELLLTAIKYGYGDSV